MSKVKVTLTNGELWNLQAALVQLIKAEILLSNGNPAPMPVKYGFKVAKLGNVLNAELRDIGKAHDELIRKFGAEDTTEGSPTKGQIIIKSDAPNREEFNKELTDLMALPCEVEIEKVALPENLALVPSALMALKDFILDMDADVVSEAERIVKGQ